MPVDQLDALEASDTESLDTTPEGQPPEAPPADDSIPAAEGGETTTDDSPSESPSEPASADAPSSIDPELAKLAASYGLDAADFSNTSSLQRAIARMDRQLAEWHGKFQGPQQQPQYGRQPQPGYQQPQQPTAPGQFDIKKLLEDAYGPEVDPATQKVLSALHEHYSQQFGGPLSKVQQVLQHLPALVEKVQAFEAHQQQQSEERFNREMDDFFTNSGEEWESVFGKGTLADLQPHSPQFQARQALVEQMDALEMADARLGRPPSSVKQLAQRALPLAFRDHFETLARKRVTKDLKKNNGAALARPSSKTGKPVDSLRRAVELNRAFDSRFSD